MKAQKGDYISATGYEQDVDTSEVLAVHREPLAIHLNLFGEEGLGIDLPQEYYLTESSLRDSQLISEHEVTRVYRR